MSTKHILPLGWRNNYEAKMLKIEMEIDASRWEAARELAAELLQAEGSNESDEDYHFELEMRTRELWQEELDRYHSKRGYR